MTGLSVDASRRYGLGSKENSSVTNPTEGSTRGDRTLHVVSKMEDRLDAGCPRQQCVLLMLLERSVVLRHLHRQAEIFLVAGRQRRRHRMPERPAQPQRSFVRE